jgi:hypothetical protein
MQTRIERNIKDFFFVQQKNLKIQTIKTKDQKKIYQVEEA